MKESQQLSTTQVVGMTISLASIKHRLLERLRPAIVLVEEAAEVLEPQLMATLVESVQHLILIGDHMQLRPPVETNSLRRRYHFDISTMERLIKSGLAHSTLRQQGRMRPEVAELLLDIYPRLTSNRRVVQMNKIPTCMLKAVFFWDHNSAEEYSQTNMRSYTNAEEAHRAVRLARFLVAQGYDKATITILAAYQGQVFLIRNQLTFELQGMTVLTIDNYQGDENDIVIVSLVRCNKNNNVGFLSELNRRCVAQSRARRGGLLHRQQRHPCLEQTLASPSGRAEPKRVRLETAHARLPSTPGRNHLCSKLCQRYQSRQLLRIVVSAQAQLWSSVQREVSAKTPSHLQRALGVHFP